MIEEMDGGHDIKTKHKKDSNSKKRKSKKDKKIKIKSDNNNNFQFDEDYRMRNPLFDAPKAIDDKDILNEQEYLSSDEEVVEKVFSPRMTRSSSRSQAFLPRIQIQSDSSDFEEIQIIPEYKKFVLPPTPEPDDSAIDAEMQEKYSLTKYIHEIRST